MVTTSSTMTSLTFVDDKAGPRPLKNQAVASPANTGAARVARRGHRAAAPAWGGGLALSRVDNHLGNISSYTVLAILDLLSVSERKQPRAEHRQPPGSNAGAVNALCPAPMQKLQRAIQGAATVHRRARAARPGGDPPSVNCQDVNRAPRIA